MFDRRLDVRSYQPCRLHLKTTTDLFPVIWVISLWELRGKQLSVFLLPSAVFWVWDCGRMFSVWDTFSWWCLFWNGGLANNYQQGCDRALLQTNLQPRELRIRTPLRPTVSHPRVTHAVPPRLCAFNAAIVAEFKQLAMCGTGFESFSVLNPGLTVTVLWH